MRCLPGVFVALLSGGAIHCARAETAPPPVVRSAARASHAQVPRQASAREQLEYALQRKRALRGAKGDERKRAREEAVEAYRAVREHFPRDLALSAEGSFRAGELLRSSGQTDAALEEFDYARVLGGKRGFGPRAGLEVAHIFRRRNRLDDALASYAAVETTADVSSAEERDLAAYWAGRVYLRLLRPIDAGRCFERAARGGVDPVQRVRAFDAWADTLIDRAELEGAAGVLDLCRDAVHEFAQEETQVGVRVRGALEAMNSIPRLKREIELRAKARSEESGPPRIPRAVGPPRVSRSSDATQAGNPPLEQVRDH